jgi:hypothetical protein
MECFATARKLRTSAVGIAAAAMLALAGCQPVQTRDDFKGTVMNKTPTEVQDKVGKPAAVDETDPAKLVWIYREVTFDIGNNNKRDATTRVIFSRQEAPTTPSVIDVDFGS